MSDIVILYVALMNCPKFCTILYIEENKDINIFCMTNVLLEK